MSRVTEIGVEDVEDRAPQGGGRDATWCDGASLDLLARETGRVASRPSVRGLHSAATCRPWISTGSYTRT